VVIGFLARRLLGYVVLSLLAVFATFGLASLTYDPIGALRRHHPAPPPSAVADKIHDLRLDVPIPQRFADWLLDALHGDFGNTVAGVPIAPDVLPRAETSLRLFLVGTVVGVVLAVVIGVAGAVRQHRLTDHVTTFLSYLLIATPVFVVGAWLKFAAVQLNTATGVDILPTDLELTAGFAGVQSVDRLRHLILPTLAIAVPMAAYLSRYQRNAMLDVLGADFLRTARAKGLTRGRALYRHGLRIALIPMATLFSYAFGTIVVGGAFVERIFDWRGMGLWLVDGINQQDTNLTATVTLFVTVCILLSGLLADIAHAALDPRIRR
jgi:peptide/nickel transport system permease protein